MKKLLTLGILATSFLVADEKAPEIETPKETIEAGYGYMSLGLGPFPIPMPLLGLGGRYQNGHNGIDGSLQFISFGAGFTLLKENIDYLYYFKPNLKSQFYAGAGVSATEIFSHGKVHTSLSPQFIVGKQYTNEAGAVRYFQAQIDPVFIETRHFGRAHVIPCVVISYGMCF